MMSAQELEAGAFARQHHTAHCSGHWGWWMLNVDYYSRALPTYVTRFPRPCESVVAHCKCSKLEVVKAWKHVYDYMG